MTIKTNLKLFLVISFESSWLKNGTSNLSLNSKSNVHKKCASLCVVASTSVSMSCIEYKIGVTLGLREFVFVGPLRMTLRDNNK